MNWLVQGGKPYWTFPFSKNSLVKVKSWLCTAKIKNDGKTFMRIIANGQPIEIGIEHAPFVFFPHLNMQKPADCGPQQN